MKMELALIMAIGILFAGTLAAFSANPDFIETKDTGSGGVLSVGLSIDCSSNALEVSVRDNDSGQPVEGAKAFLFYTNYGYQPMGSGSTDSDGKGTVGLVGKRDFLTSLFVIRVEKAGYMSREIEFTYKKCLEAPPEAGQETQGGQAGSQSQNASTQQGQGNQAEGTASQNPEPGIKTGNQNSTTQQNQSGTGNVTPVSGNRTPNPGNGTQGTGSLPERLPGPCPAAALLAITAVAMAIKRK